MELNYIPIHDPAVFSWHVEDGYEFLTHWRGTNRLSPGHTWFEVRDDSDTQVALLELDQSNDRAYWQGTVYPLPLEGPEVLEIQFIDVRDTYRGRGIGIAIVAQVAARYPHHQLIALSERADHFWESLGWKRIDRADSLPGRPMYVSPVSELD